MHLKFYNRDMNKIKIKKGDQVMVITGENKGTKGTVLKVLYNSNKALVEGVNTVKKTYET